MKWYMVSIIAILTLVTLQVFSQNKMRQQKTTMKKNKKESGSLRFLYMTSSGKVVRSIIKNKWFSSLAGVYADSRISKREIKPFVRKHAINMSEAQKPVGDYTSFNDFFARKLTPAARPINTDALSIISPADGHLLVIENLQHTTKFPVKDLSFNLEKFLGDKQRAESYLGGTLVIFRLAPWDYHRFHFPLSGIAQAPQVIHGKYESVNPIAYAAGIQPLTENERHIILFKTEHCSTIAIVPVGALCVGRLVETYKPGTMLNKGTEAGYFEFGGSTVVLVFPKNSVHIDENILNNSRASQETSIKMGQRVGRCAL